VLKEEVEEESSGSVMSADADSEMPSENEKSKEMKSSIDNQVNHLTKGGHKMKGMKKTLSIEKQISTEERRLRS
jgi:hypothetical protein